MTKNDYCFFQTCINFQNINLTWVIFCKPSHQQLHDLTWVEKVILHYEYYWQNETVKCCGINTLFFKYYCKTTAINTSCKSNIIFFLSSPTSQSDQSWFSQTLPTTNLYLLTVQTRKPMNCLILPQNKTSKLSYCAALSWSVFT